MPGMIMLWYGEVVDIPSGWALCNGANNTPDLRNKFIVGAKDAGPGYDPGDTGGSKIHSHAFTGDGHSHDLTPGDTIKLIPPEGTLCDCSSTDAATGNTADANVLPPYHALCYIMKLPIT